MVRQYKYYIFGHYPSSRLYLKTASCLFFKTRRFGDWTLSPCSGSTQSIELGTKQNGVLDKDRTMDNA
jgi:hypothetical protein